jgi:hypothetical protein
MYNEHSAIISEGASSKKGSSGVVSEELECQLHRLSHGLNMLTGPHHTFYRA